MQRCTSEAMSTGDKVFAVRLQTTQHAKRGMIDDCVIWKWFEISDAPNVRRNLGPTYCIAQACTLASACIY